MRWIEGPILGFDTETTSADPMEAIPVSYGFALRRDEHRISRMGSLINPGVPIPPGATEVNGITDEMVKRSGMPLDEAMEFVKDKLNWAATEQVPVTGMNLVFDFTIVHRMAGLLTEELLPFILDVFVLDKTFDKWRKGSRKLGALVKHYGVSSEHLTEHDATWDAVACILIVDAMAKAHPWFAQTSLPTLMGSQRRWQDEQQRGLSDYFVKQGDPAIPEDHFGWPIQKRAVT